LVGADLLTAFGTPENLCDTDDAAVHRINLRLQNGECYEEACLKSDQCREESSIYDSELRGRQIIAALKEGYNCKLKEQNQLENDVPDSDTLSGHELDTIAGLFSALHIDVAGPFKRDAHSWELPAVFRGTSVVALFPVRLGDGPRENIIFASSLAVIAL
jgi:hypothetical protein